MKYLEYFLVLIITSYIYSSNIDNIKFHPDESHWVSTSIYFDELIKGNIHSSIWEPGYWTLTQPPLTRYIIGISRKLNGYGPENINELWEYRRDYMTNIESGAKPLPGLLRTARIPMLIMASLSILVIFYMVRINVSIFAAYILYILIISSKYLVSQLLRAMSESPLLFFIVLTMLVITVLARHLMKIDRSIFKNSKKLAMLIIYASLVGLLTGLAGATKLNGFSLIGVSTSLLLILLFFSDYLERISSKARKLLISLLICVTAITSVGVFISINPFLYKNSIKRSVALFKWRIFEMKKQSEKHGTSDLTRLNLTNRIIRIGNNVFNNYASLRFKGAPILNIIFFIIGFYITLKNTWEFVKGRGDNLYYVVVLLMSVIVAGPSLLTLLDWDRYFYLPVFFSTILISIGIAESLRYIVHLNRFRKFTTPYPSLS